MALGKFDRTITFTNSGEAVGGATVQVDLAAGGAASLFSDREGTSPISNPVTADADGRVTFYVAQGRFNIVATDGSFNATYTDVVIYPDPEEKQDTIEDSITLTNPATPALQSRVHVDDSTGREFITVESGLSGGKVIVYGENDSLSPGSVEIFPSSTGSVNIFSNDSANPQFSISSDEVQEIRRGGSLEQIATENQLSVYALETDLNDLSVYVDGLIDPDFVGEISDTFNPVGIDDAFVKISLVNASTNGTPIPENGVVKTYYTPGTAGSDIDIYQEIEYFSRSFPSCKFSRNFLVSSGNFSLWSFTSGDNTATLNIGDTYDWLLLFLDKVYSTNSTDDPTIDLPALFGNIPSNVSDPTFNDSIGIKIANTSGSGDIEVSLGDQVRHLPGGFLGTTVDVNPNGYIEVILNGEPGPGSFQTLFLASKSGGYTIV